MEDCKLSNKYTRTPLSEKYQNIYYVYKAFVDGELKYIGKGKGDRWKHCNSDKSSCGELNRDFYEGKSITVEKYKTNLGSKEADILEMQLISEYPEDSLYNVISYTPFKSSKPNVESMKNAKILASGRDDLVIKQLCKINPSITKEAFDKLKKALYYCEIDLHLVNFDGTAAPVLVLDKEKFSIGDVAHCGCFNWPNCDEYGCGPGWS